MDDALKHCAELKALFRRHAGSWLDPELLLSIDSIEDRQHAAPRPA